MEVRKDCITSEIYIYVKIYYEKMSMIYYIKRNYFDVKYTYLLLSVPLQKSKSETERLYEERFL